MCGRSSSSTVPSLVRHWSLVRSPTTGPFVHDSRRSGVSRSTLVLVSRILYGSSRRGRHRTKKNKDKITKS